MQYGDTVSCHPSGFPYPWYVSSIRLSCFMASIIINSYLSPDGTSSSKILSLSPMQSATCKPTLSVFIIHFTIPLHPSPTCSSGNTYSPSAYRIQSSSRTALPTPCDIYIKSYGGLKLCHYSNHVLSPSRINLPLSNTIMIVYQFNQPKIRFKLFGCHSLSYFS